MNLKILPLCQCQTEIEIIYPRLIRYPNSPKWEISPMLQTWHIGKAAYKEFNVVIMAFLVQSGSIPCFTRKYIVTTYLLEKDNSRQTRDYHVGVCIYFNNHILFGRGRITCCNMKRNDNISTPLPQLIFTTATLLQVARIVFITAEVRFHDDVIKWKHFPRYWPFVRGIHRSRWIPRTKASDVGL